MLKGTIVAKIRIALNASFEIERKFTTKLTEIEKEAVSELEENRKTWYGFELILVARGRGLNSDYFGCQIFTYIFINLIS